MNLYRNWNINEAGSKQFFLLLIHLMISFSVSQSIFLFLQNDEKIPEVSFEKADVSNENASEDEGDDEAEPTDFTSHIPTCFGKCDEVGGLGSSHRYKQKKQTAFISLLETEMRPLECSCKLKRE